MAELTLTQMKNKEKAIVFAQKNSLEHGKENFGMVDLQKLYMLVLHLLGYSQLYLIISIWAAQFPMCILDLLGKWTK